MPFDVRAACGAAPRDQPTHPARPPACPAPPADKHLEWIARLMGCVNAVLDGFRAAKAWAMSQGALALAVAVLLLAILLRWLGWL